MENKQRQFYLNMNGNSKEGLTEDYINVQNAIQELRNALAWAEMWHGRNSKDAEHMHQLNVQKLELYGLLDEFQLRVEETCKPLTTL